MKPILIIGAGSGGRFSLDICRSNGENVAGFLDDNIARDETRNAIPVIGPLTTLDEQGIADQFRFLICVSDFALRRTLYNKLKAMGADLANAIHPSVEISNTAHLGEHVIVNAYTIIHANASIGDLVVVEGHSSIGVDNNIGTNVLFATGIMLNGNVTIEDDVFLGSGAVVIPNCTIGHGSYLGAGAVVTGDIPADSLAVGVPARVIKPSPQAGTSGRPPI